MQLKLLLVQKNITTPAEIKELNKIQQAQLTLELKAYLGKKISFKEAFDGEINASFWQIASTDKPEKILYDFWEINSDSGCVFLANSTEEAGVEMIQGSFDVTAKYTGHKDVVALAQALNTAERGKMLDPNFSFNKTEEILDFKSKNAIPKDSKEWLKLLKNHKVSESFIRKYHSEFTKACWNQVCETASLSELFLMEFAKQINWDTISQFQVLSEDFIRKNKDRLNWLKISWRQKLSENFIREFKDTVNWDYISGNQVLSEAFIKEFMEKLSWVTISWAQKLSENFIREYQEKIHWANLLAYKHLSEDLLKEFSGKFDANCWDRISATQVLSSAFIDEFSAHINWMSLSRNHSLTDEQLRRYKEKLNWNSIIVFGRDLPEKLLHEFWDQISANKYNLEYILKHKKRFPISKKFEEKIQNHQD